MAQKLTESDQARIALATQLRRGMHLVAGANPAPNSFWNLPKRFEANSTNSKQHPNESEVQVHGKDPARSWFLPMVNHSPTRSIAP